MSILPTIVDVSHHQGAINWNTAKNNILFAILRVQDGTVLDRQLSRNISECERLGIPYYCYGFYRGGGATEANRMVSRAKAAGAKNVLGYVCDVEASGYNKNNIKAFFKALPSGLKNGLYVSHNLYSQYGTGYGEDWVWIPRYGSNNGKPSTKPNYACDLWQFTSTGRVPGISGNVDCNACMNKGLDYFEGDNMQPIDVWNYKNKDMNGTKDAYQLLTDVHRASQSTQTTVAAMQAAIKALSESVGADPDTIAKTVSDAVAAKLETIDLNVTVGD